MRLRSFRAHTFRGRTFDAIFGKTSSADIELHATEAPDTFRFEVEVKKRPVRPPPPATGVVIPLLPIAARKRVEAELHVTEAPDVFSVKVELGFSPREIHDNVVILTSLGLT